MKPQIYKVGTAWVVWIPGVRVHPFKNWESAVRYVLELNSSQQNDLSAKAAAK